MKILALIEKDFEDLEHSYPVIRLREAGYEVVVAGPEAGVTYHGKHGVPDTSDIAFSDVDPKAYAGILIPGGWAPDKLRRYEKVLEIVRSMESDKKLIATICHAGWVVISAGVTEGKTVTSTVGIRDDMVNAGATWKDQAVVIDGHWVSSRSPGDLGPYMRAILSFLEDHK